MDENFLSSSNTVVEQRDKTITDYKNVAERFANLSGTNIAKEREFKLEVLNWLNNG
jgi:hypothetical protein